MEMVHVRRLYPEIYEPIALEMMREIRCYDEMELRIIGKKTEQAMLESMECSVEVYMAQCEPYGDLLGVFGLAAGRIGKLGTPVWFLGTKLAERYPKEFLQYGREYCKRFLQLCGTPLCNYIWELNTPALRFIRRLGAEMLPPVLIGNSEQKFYPFVLKEVK